MKSQRAKLLGGLLSWASVWMMSSSFPWSVNVSPAVNPQSGACPKSEWVPHKEGCFKTSHANPKYKMPLQHPLPIMPDLAECKTPPLLWPGFVQTLWWDVRIQTLSPAHRGPLAAGSEQHPWQIWISPSPALIPNLVQPWPLSASLPGFHFCVSSHFLSFKLWFVSFLLVLVPGTLSWQLH